MNMRKIIDRNLQGVRGQSDQWACYKRQTWRRFGCWRASPLAIHAPTLRPAIASSCSHHRIKGIVIAVET